MPLTLSPTQLAFNARSDGSFNKPFQAQVAFFRSKLNLPTQHYDDILTSAHDRAFMVAGAMKADLLDDLRKAVDQAIEQGQSIGWFRQQFDSIVQKHGWEGWTGSDSAAGRAWRTRVIYQTNLSTSYAAGRWAQLHDPDLLSVKPYWKYVHSDAVSHPRPLHVSWDGLVLRYDDPWWLTHFAPNGWGCRCRIVPVKAGEFKGQHAPDDGTYIKVDRFGQRHEIPNGIDYGWDYAPGSRLDVSLRSMVQDKLIRYPPAISKALTRDVNRYINAHQVASEFAASVLADKTIQEPAWLGFVEQPEAVKSVTAIDTTGYLVLLPSDSIRHIDNHHRYDGKGQRAATPTDYDLVTKILLEGDLSPTTPSPVTGLLRFIARASINGDEYRCVFEVSGKKLRAVSLVTMAIKTK